jgi:putative addiction module component (TIGR02574 family)
MGKVESLQDEVKTLSRHEMVQLRAWFLDLDWSSWDKELADDAMNRRLDRLAEQELREFASSRTTGILCALMVLPPNDRIDIAQALWGSLRDSEIDAGCPLTNEQIAELERRIEDDLRNPDAGIPWEEARRELLASIGVDPDSEEARSMGRQRR